MPTPTLNHLFKNHPHILLEASGAAVGLPKGQMGNSEVGHLHLGAGRKVPQDLTRINHSIETGEFFKNHVLQEALTTAKQTNKAVHIIGLVSPGGVHSVDMQIAAMVKMIHVQGITKNYLHAILDGRDTPPKSAMKSLSYFEDIYRKLNHGGIASIIGRYYAMDRDKRWDRTQKAYELLTQNIAERSAATAVEGLQLAYQHNETDEFVKPTNIHAANAAPIHIEDGDVVIFMNFRADRARQLSHALSDKTFTDFERHQVPHLGAFVTLTEYDKTLSAKAAFPTINLKNTLGEYVAAHGCRQLRIAETEKYAHVTYFINGGVEKTFPNEDRMLVPSPKVATYDLKPEMSAVELTDKLVTAIQSDQYDLIICNYANPDMVGHTGNKKAAEKAVSVIDRCIERIINALKQTGGEALITADHGNIECMYDETHDQPHTAHTTNLVPLIYFGREATFIMRQGHLDDVAPTLLHAMGLEIPQEMTGHILLKFSE